MQFIFGGLEGEVSQLGKLSSRIQAAEKAMDIALERAFPVLSIVEFNIMYGQVNPSRGEVIGYSGGSYAYLRVRLESRTRAVRDVSAFDVRLVKP
ncbi:MAG: hypothetical protein ACTS6J_12145 [Burkholderiales bacterium]